VDAFFFAPTAAVRSRNQPKILANQEGKRSA
jgi:hypothetical protein